MDSEANGFMYVWDTALIMVAGAAFLLALAILIFHRLSVVSIKSYKGKYDYLNKHEIKRLKVVFISIAVAAGCLTDIFGPGVDEFHPVWFGVKLAIGIAAGTLVGYISVLILNYYYPTILNKKLMKWRYMPRINPKNGQPMRLLSEAEEDIYLDEGMQAEEEIFSVDYDVWIDDETGDTQIEKYAGHLQAVQCGNCSFYTMRVVREEIEREPTSEEDGYILKYYECGYCKSRKTTRYPLTKIDHQDQLIQRALKKSTASGEEIELVRVILYQINGTKQEYDFQSPELAQEFLDKLKEKTFP